MPAVRLIYVDDSLPGLTRERHGDSWRYCDVKGKAIADGSEIARLDAVALPPAYRDAWYCPAANGHILATGYDARGRKQYRYHPDFRRAQDADKYDRCQAFGHALPLLRARLADDLRKHGLGRDRMIAAVVRLLDLAALRVGSDQYASNNNSYGATTLRMRHASIRGQALRLSYRGKGGLMRNDVVNDRSLITLVRKMQDLPGQRLFQYEDEGGSHAVGSADVNAYIQSVMGAEYSAKHFRTWAASVAAFTHLYDAADPPTLKTLLGDVSAQLGNTPAVARRAYVHPALIDAALAGDNFAAEVGKLPRATRYLSRYERGFLSYLDQSPSAQILLQSA